MRGQHFLDRVAAMPELTVTVLASSKYPSMNNFAHEFGDLIHFFRVDRNYRWKDLTNLLNISKQTIKNWSEGLSAPPVEEQDLILSAMRDVYESGVEEDTDE